MTQPKTPDPAHHEDEHLGAVEGDKPSNQPNQGNPNGPGVDKDGLPDNPVGTSAGRNRGEPGRNRGGIGERHEPVNG